MLRQMTVTTEGTQEECVHIELVLHQASTDFSPDDPVISSLCHPCLAKVEANDGDVPLLVLTVHRFP